MTPHRPGLGAGTSHGATSMVLAGGASTNSRGQRPLPPGAVSARTVLSDVVGELVEFYYLDGTYKQDSLLSWVAGQHGCLWGRANQFHLPIEIGIALSSLSETPGSYGHAAEYALAEALGIALGPVFGAAPLACRFYQSGGEAMAAAARLARHATGRKTIASYGYHGAAAEWAHAPNTAGIPPEHWQLHARFEWGDVAAVEQLAQHCAAICVEVPAIDDEQAISAFLRACRQACDRGGAVFILDEVVTGFRLALGGAAEWYGVRPDIACYGKAMSATGAVAAVVGRRELVDPIGGKVFYSTTFGGNPGPCAVAAATVQWLTENRGEAYGYLGYIGRLLKDGYNALGIKCIGHPARSIFQFESDAAWLDFCSRMIERDVMVHRPNFVTLVHTKADVERTLDAAREVVAQVAA